MKLSLSINEGVQMNLCETRACVENILSIAKRIDNNCETMHEKCTNLARNMQTTHNDLAQQKTQKASNELCDAIMQLKDLEASVEDLIEKIKHLENISTTW